MSKIEIINGDALVKELSRNPIQHTYTINPKSKIEVKENTLFFPGWAVMVNGNPLLINYKHVNSPGVITFKLDKGMYDVSIKFIDLPVIILAKWLSLISLLTMVIYALIPKKLLKFNFPKL